MLSRLMVRRVFFFFGVCKPRHPVLSYFPFQFLLNPVTIKDNILCGSASQKGFIQQKGYIQIGNSGFGPEIQTLEIFGREEPLLLHSLLQCLLVVLFSSTHTPLSWILPTSTLNCCLLFLLTCSQECSLLCGGSGKVVFRRQKRLLIKITTENPLNLTEGTTLYCHSTHKTMYTTIQADWRVWSVTMDTLEKKSGGWIPCLSFSRAKKLKKSNLCDKIMKPTLYETDRHTLLKVLVSDV